MEIGSITSSYLSRIALNYGAKSEEEKNTVSSLMPTDYDSYVKSDAKDVEKESYYNDYSSMAEKILGKDLETAIHNTKRMIYGLSSALLNPDSTNAVTNYYDSSSLAEQVDNSSLKSLLGVDTSEEKGIEVEEPLKNDSSSNGVQDAQEEDKGETETKIVMRNGVRYVETTTTYSDGRTTVETRALDGYTSKECGINNLMSML